MARDFNGSTQSGSVSLDLSAFSTITVGMWVYPDAFSGSFNMFTELTADGQSNTGGFSFYRSAANGIVLATQGNVGDSVAFSGSGTNVPSTGTWSHIVAIYDYTQAAGSEVAYWLNGSSISMTNSSSNNNTGTFANDTLYVAARTSSTLYYDGKIADYFIAGYALTAAEIAALADGESADTVAQKSRSVFFPLWGNESPERSWWSSHSLTLSNTPAKSSHPPTFARTGRGRWRLPLTTVGGGNSTHAANITITNTISVTKQVNKNISAPINNTLAITEAATFTRSGNITITNSLTSAQQSVYLHSANLTITDTVTTSRITSFKKAVSAGVTNTVSVVRSISKNIAVAITNTVTNTKQTNKNISAPVTNTVTASEGGRFPQSGNVTITNTVTGTSYTFIPNIGFAIKHMWRNLWLAIRMRL